MTTTRKVALLIALLFSNPAWGYEIELGSQVRQFDEVVRVYGEIRDGASLLLQIKLSMSQAKGDVLVLISTPGGRCSEGDKIYATLRKYAGRHRLICFVHKEAQSMGFNILSQCDERWGEDDATYMMHDPSNVYTVDKPDEEGKYEFRMTVRKLRSDLLELQKTARVYRESNRKALGISRKRIDALCDKGDTEFTAEDLVELGYLKGIGRMME